MAANIVDISADARVSAAVLQFPDRHGMNRMEMAARHSWMMERRGKWETKATDGVKYETDPMVIQVKEIVREMMGCPELAMERMRRDIAEGRRLIEKRNRVKAWLVSMGVDLGSIKDAEQALFAAFDKLA